MQYSCHRKALIRPPQSTSPNLVARELITSWADFQTAIDRLLVMACRQIQIYDEDLSTLRLESATRKEQIKRFLQLGQGDALQIAVRRAASFRLQHPQLQSLLDIYGHLAKARETPPQLAHLRDSMLLVDGRHALIRFDREQPRSKLLIDETCELRPYLTRFHEIWSEGGESISGATLGL